MFDWSDSFLPFYAPVRSHCPKNQPLISKTNKSLFVVTFIPRCSVQTKQSANLQMISGWFKVWTPPVFSGAGTQQRATCWICVCWCFGSPSTAQVFWRSVACWLTAAARWGGSWAVMSCWSPASTPCSAAPLTTGTRPSQRGQVGAPTPVCSQ